MIFKRSKTVDEKWKLAYQFDRFKFYDSPSQISVCLSVCLLNKIWIFLKKAKNASIQEKNLHNFKFLAILTFNLVIYKKIARTLLIETFLWEICQILTLLDNWLKMPKLPPLFRPFKFHQRLKCSEITILHQYLRHVLMFLSKN